ncbi:phosphate signaling complex protein PhoU [Natronobeatus ordinarius]|uniref:phosphate signaling complex protein PhoU n=1 Tax=Natronobeatus ordinarius TaxID=2963433 RepID=UPI0020CE3C15|nr:phosphate signaling complex protein PhoU [Natronobeatus ordinarius]
MPRTDYQRQLEALREDVLDMSDLVRGRLQQAIRALEDGDVERAEAVIEGDYQINERYLELEGACIELIALQQPVAGDLRVIASSFKVITDIERIGDLATNLGKYTTPAGGIEHPTVDVEEIGEYALEMVDAAMGAYATDDADAAREVAAMDDHLDARCAEASSAVVRELLEADPAAEADDWTDAETALAEVSRMLLILRDLERVGDHAVNVAARTLYMVENDDELIY